MRYLRMFSNSAIAGAVAAAYVAVLVLQLESGSVALGVVHVVAGGDDPCRLRYPSRRALLRDHRRPSAARPRSAVARLVQRAVLASFCAGASTAAAVLMWLNLRGFRVALDDEAAQRMTLGASAMTACAVAFVLLAIVRYSVGPPRCPAGGLAAATLVVLSLALPLAAGECGPARAARRRRSATPIPVVEPREGSRVWLIGIDGASLDIISPAAADGRLPSFGRLLDGGASLHLATLRPDAAGAGVDGGGHGKAAGEKRRPLGGDVHRSGGRRGDRSAARTSVWRAGNGVRWPVSPRPRRRPSQCGPRRSGRS